MTLSIRAAALSVAASALLAACGGAETTTPAEPVEPVQTTQTPAAPAPAPAPMGAPFEGTAFAALAGQSFEGRINGRPATLSFTQPRNGILTETLTDGERTVTTTYQRIPDSSTGAIGYERVTTYKTAGATPEREVGELTLSSDRGFTASRALIGAPGEVPVRTTYSLKGDTLEWVSETQVDGRWTPAAGTDWTRTD